MLALLASFWLFGLATGQTTQSGCSCKSSSEVKWRLSGGKIGGGFSHYGCGTGPYEDKSPAHGQNWCDTQQSSCNDGQGWDFCNAAEAVNVNTGETPNPSTGSPAVNLNVNVNVGTSSTNSNSAPITTVQGCTCHATSEVILMQNGVRVGGGFSHTGCGTGPYEASSPGHGSPWCDTIETWCSAGWDLCTPPASHQNNYPASSQSSYTPPLPSSYIPRPPIQNSFTSTTNTYAAFSSAGTYQPAFPPTPYPTPYPQPQPWQSSPSYQAPNPFQPFQQPVQQPFRPPSYQPPSTPAYQPPPSYQPPQTQSQFVSQSQYQYTSQTQYPSAFLTQQSKSSLAIIPVPVQKPVPPQLRSPFSSPRPPVARPRPHHRGGSDYDYDDSSSTSSLLPLMLLNGASASGGKSGSSGGKSGSGSSSSSLLPLMLASQNGGGSSMLPMMMMMNPSSFSGTNANMLTQFAMLNAFRREGDGEAQDAQSLGEVGENLGFTRAVVSKSSSDTQSDSSLDPGNATLSNATSPVSNASSSDSSVEFP